ncbi:hypothetical protein HPP92_028500 [Vanilla planifolia]|uniref:Uncharacterized protein n=1 Tax=Vanilla planifolia TaxID=51239 RepID=A0A835P556_VANPL|nr:hypothetical protein HPP92_028500 [Vanilla planifolia]
MGKRKERRLAAMSATRRVKLDLFAEPSVAIHEFKLAMAILKEFKAKEHVVTGGEFGLNYEDEIEASNLESCEEIKKEIDIRISDCRALLNIWVSALLPFCIRKHDSKQIESALENILNVEDDMDVEMEVDDETLPVSNCRRVNDCYLPKPCRPPDSAKPSIITKPLPFPQMIMFHLLQKRERISPPPEGETTLLHLPPENEMDLS